MNLLATIGIRLLEILFFAGWVGSAILLLLTTIEDVGTILGREDHHAD